MLKPRPFDHTRRQVDITANVIPGQSIWLWSSLVRLSSRTTIYIFFQIKAYHKINLQFSKNFFLHERTSQLPFSIMAHKCHGTNIKLRTKLNKPLARQRDLIAKERKLMTKQNELTAVVRGATLGLCMEKTHPPSFLDQWETSAIPFYHVITVRVKVHFGRDILGMTGSDRNRK